MNRPGILARVGLWVCWLLVLLAGAGAVAAVRADFPLHKVYVGGVPLDDEGETSQGYAAEHYFVVRRFREVHVWDNQSGKYLGRFFDDAKGTDITAASLTGEGTLWLGTSTGQVSAWNLATMQQTQSFQIGGDPVIHLMADAQADRVYAYTRGVIHSFQIKTGQRVFRSELGDSGCRGLREEAMSGALLCVTMEGRLQLVHKSDGRILDVPNALLLGQEEPVRSVVQSTKNNTLIYLGEDQCAYLVTESSGRRSLSKVNVDCGHIAAISVSPDGAWAVVAASDGKINIIGLSASTLRVADVGASPVASITWAADSRHLYLTTKGDAARGYGQTSIRLAMDDERSIIVYSGASTQFVNDAAISGSNLFTCMNTGNLVSWRLTDLEPEQRQLKLRNACMKVAGLASGTWLLAGDASGHVVLIDIRTASISSEVVLSGAMIHGLGLFEQSDGVLTGFVATREGSIFSLSVTNQRLTLGPEIRRMNGPFQAVAFGKDQLLLTTKEGFEVIDLQGGHRSGQRFSLLSVEPGIATLDGVKVFVPSIATETHLYSRAHDVWSQIPVTEGGYIAGALLGDGVFIGGMIDGNVRAFQTTTGQLLDEFKVGLGTVRNILVDRIRQHAIVFGTDGSFVVWDRRRQRWIARAWTWSDEETSVVTSDGYFKFTGQRPLKEMLLRTQPSANKIVPAMAFFDVFHRPDLVRATLMGDEDYVKRASQELTIEKALKNPPPSIGTLSAPKVEITTERIRIPYTIKSEGGGVGEVLVLHNGKLIKSDGYYKDAPGSTMVAMNTTKASSVGEVAKGVQKMLGSGESTSAASNRDSVVVRQAKPKTLNAAGEYSDSVEIEVIPGEENEITVMARNQDNTILGQGQTVRFKSSLPKADPHLWILPVGIASFQDRGVPKLASPKKDALDFACSYGGKEALKNAGVNCDKPGYANSLFKSSNIHVIDPLTNEKATRANILAKLDEIATKAKPTDTFIWFVSSHGTMDANSVYGIVPFDAKCQGPKCEAASGLVSSNDILEKSKAIKAMKQLLILDTCNAGGLDNKMSGLYDARMSGLAKNMGLHLYAAATSTESALDGQDATKNSIFTATLLEGLSGASQKDSEGRISIIPLGQYVKTNTAEASRKAYADIPPQTPVIQHFGKDAPLAGVGFR